MKVREEEADGRSEGGHAGSWRRDGTLGTGRNGELEPAAPTPNRDVPKRRS